MKLVEALHIVNLSQERRRAGALAEFRVGLSCGFTPLHFKTFLNAHLASLRPNTSFGVIEGLYGDLAGNLERLRDQKCDAVVAVIEWADLDPRLGLRSTGGWQPENLSDIIRRADLQLERIASGLKQLEMIPRIVAGPTLPLPPVSYSRSRRLSSFEADLLAAVDRFYQQALSDRVAVIRSQAIDAASPPAARLDIKSEFAAGYPYTMQHGDVLARLMAEEAFPRPRKKGLITDLDDTLWRGILGEIGVDGICWALDKHAHLHALYQQLLGSLAASGTLVAVASKNDPDLVAQALGRQDLLLPKEALFPIEAQWGRKSEAVQRILAAWNIGSDAVVFVDDSPMELAEVKAAFPDMECLAFSPDDPAKVWALLSELRDRFGVNELTNEDSLRLESLRSRVSFEGDRSSAGDPDRFLRDAQAEITFLIDKGAERQRAFELLNKTNQFNLNGARLNEAEWAVAVAPHDPRFVVKIAYSDCYGPLGNIAVLVGDTEGDRVNVHHWVMSCRAFSRRIEHRCLQFLLDRFHSDEILLRFQPTMRNGPVQEFLSTFLDPPASGDVLISRTLFEKNCPPLYHSVREI